MDWVSAIIGLLLLGYLVPLLAMGVCLALGGALAAVDRLTTRCPGCGRRRMHCAGGTPETYPVGHGAGWFYQCRACGGRWFWSNHDRAWQDASSPDVDWAFG